MFQVVTPDGWLFDKEAVLKYMLEKKQEYSRKLKEYERQKARESSDAKLDEEAERKKAVEKFERTEKSLIIKKSGKNDDDSSKANLPSYWIPALTPQVRLTSNQGFS